MQNKQTLLIVDDVGENIDVLAEVFKELAISRKTNTTDCSNT